MKKGSQRNRKRKRLRMWFGNAQSGKKSVCGNIFSHLFKLRTFAFQKTHFTTEYKVNSGRWSLRMRGHATRTQAKHQREEKRKRNTSENRKQRVNKERYKQWKGKGEAKLVAGSHRGALSNLWLSGSVLTWVQVCLSVRTGQHQRGWCFLWALHQS